MTSARALRFPRNGIVPALKSLLTLLSWLHCAFLATSRPTDCFHVTVSIFLLDVFPSPDATLLASDFPVVSSPFAWWYTYHLAFPCTLRKVRDSNPRIVSTIAALAVRCFQPDSANLPFFVYCVRIASSHLSSSHGVFSAHSTFFFNFMQKRPFTPFSAFSHCLHLSVIDSSLPSTRHTYHWQCSSQSHTLDMPSEYS